MIENGLHEDVQLGGAWEVVDHIAVDVEPSRFTSCGEPLGDEYGFNLPTGAHDDTIQFSRAFHAMAGVHLAHGANHNRIEHNLLAHNDMVTAFHRNPANDLGAWGVLVDSSDNDIGWNTFSHNMAVCSNQGYQRASNSVELYTAAGNSIHDNQAYGDRVFSELGSSSRYVSADNVYSYNLFVTSAAHSRFITTRGALDRTYGPVRNTVLYHNTTYETGFDSQGIVCSSGCNDTILTANSNVIWADTKVFYADRATNNGRNLFWSSSGSPMIQAPPLSRSNVIANPRFVDPSLDNFRVRSTSLARSLGGNNGAWGVDIYHDRLPLPPTPLTAGAAQ